MSASKQTASRMSQVARAFDEAAAGYDAAWTRALLGRLQRQQVRRAARTLFRPGDRILELGCGTGADAAWFAASGVRVHATDISERMLGLARERVERHGLSDRVTFELLAMEELARAQDSGPFDGALSNFGAVNCVRDLRPTAESLSRMVRPGGKIVLCFMGRFCAWETLWHLLRLTPSKAFRRLRAGSPGIESALGPNCRFRVFYPSIAELAQAFDRFEMISDRGIAVFVPPSCVEPYARAWRRLVGRLARVDARIGSWPIIRACGDHRMVVFERTECS